MKTERDITACGAFGRTESDADRLEALRVKKMLARRLREKVRNYSRAASRLEMRGEVDAAAVLTRAADRLKTIAVDAESEELAIRAR